MRFLRWFTGVALSALLFLGSNLSLYAQENKETLTVSDVERTYKVRLPTGYDRSQKYPVMILLHGMNQEADDMERLTLFDSTADKNGVIAVYPSALHGRWNIGVRPSERESTPGYPGGGRRRGLGFPGGGYPGGGYPGGGYPRGGGSGYPGGGQSGGRGPGRREQENRSTPADDVEFLGQMLDQVNTKYSVDSARVYLAGLSEGGMMAIKAGCSMADRVAAIVSVGASMPKTMVCLPSRPIPVLMFNGTADPVVPYKGGTEHNLRLAVISVGDTVKAFAKIDRCAAKPTTIKLPPSAKGGLEAREEAFTSCQQNAQVVSYVVKDGGNTWPGGEQYEVEKEVGKTSRDLNADQVMWDFLSNKKLAADKYSEAGAKP